MSDERRKSEWKRGAITAETVAVLFAAYMGAYETMVHWHMGTFLGNPGPRFFIGRWSIPSKIAEPFFAPAHWIDKLARHLLP